MIQLTIFKVLNNRRGSVGKAIALQLHAEDHGSSHVCDRPKSLMGIGTKTNGVREGFTIILLTCIKFLSYKLIIKLHTLTHPY